MKTLYMLMTRVHKQSLKKVLPEEVNREFWHKLTFEASHVQTYVFIEEEDFYRNEITNDDVLFRIVRLIEDTVILTET